MVAWRARDHGRVIARLAPVRAGLRRVGGSHAQRDLFVLLLLDSAVATGNRALADAVRAERSVLRPRAALPPRLRAAT
jgi:hypothetical protein